MSQAHAYNRRRNEWQKCWTNPGVWSFSCIFTIDFIFVENLEWNEKAVWISLIFEFYLIQDELSSFISGAV